MVTEIPWKLLQHPFVVVIDSAEHHQLVVVLLDQLDGAMIDLAQAQQEEGRVRGAARMFVQRGKNAFLVEGGNFRTDVEAIRSNEEGLAVANGVGDLWVFQMKEVALSWLHSIIKCHDLLG